MKFEITKEKRKKNNQIDGFGYFIQIKEFLDMKGRVKVNFISRLSRS